MNTLSINKCSSLRSCRGIIVLLKLSLILLMPFTVSANTSLEYQGGEARLDSKARNSKELYVEPDFAFETFKTMTLEISVVDPDGQPVSGAIALISDIPEDVQDLSDQRLEKKSLISVHRSDEYGRIYQELEMSNSVTKIILELSIQSQNNKVIMEIDNEQYITHFFELE